MDSTIVIDAMIRVPDVGTFRYVGKARKSQADNIRSALELATLDERRRQRPYDEGNGIRMYDDESGRRSYTFGTLDFCTIEATMVSVIGSCSDRCRRYLSRHNDDASVEVCEALGDYAGVYVMEWSIKDAWSDVPDSERQFLCNSDP